MPIIRRRPHEPEAPDLGMLRPECTASLPSIDGWRAILKSNLTQLAFGCFAATLDTAKLEIGQTVDFTVRWSDGTWIGEEFLAAVVPPLQPTEAAELVSR